MIPRLDEATTTDNFLQADAITSICRVITRANAMYSYHQACHHVCGTKLVVELPRRVNARIEEVREAAQDAYASANTACGNITRALVLPEAKGSGRPLEITKPAT